MSFNEKRKGLRRAVSYPAWIDLRDGNLPLKAALRDASEQGAKLQVAEDVKLPDKFVLALDAGGAATRQCRVVWRTGKEVGVRFLKLRKPRSEGSGESSAEPPQADTSAGVPGAPDIATPPQG